MEVAGTTETLIPVYYIAQHHTQ